MDNWIKIEDKAPEIDRVVFIFSAPPYSPEIVLGMRINDRNIFHGKNNAYYNNVTHWMPLPEPPKELTPNA